MSYILDALRKADAERERGAVPGLNAQPLPPLSADPDGEPARRRWPWAAGAAGLLLAAVLAAWLADRPAPPPGPPGRPTGAADLPAPNRGERTPALPPPPAAAAAPEPAAPLPLPAAAPPLPRPATPPRAAAASTAAAAAPANAPIPPLRDLPDELKRQVPALGIGGSMYSKDPASRMLIVNGQVLHEGDEVAPGLVLEQIRLKSAVLRLKQQRFEISW